MFGLIRIQINQSNYFDIKIYPFISYFSLKVITRASITHTNVEFQRRPARDDIQ